MQQLHSNTTFFRKFIFPIILLSLPAMVFLVFLKMEFWIGSVIAFMVLAIAVGISKNFYWGLKYVYLDEENRQLIIEEKKEKVVIKFEAMEDIEIVKILSLVVVVKLKTEVKGMTDFAFIPRDLLLYRSPIVDKLKRLIENSTAVNSR